MCGIVGYIGKQNAVRVGLGCLKQLEYRGYDSSGIAFFSARDKKFLLKKAVGRIANLEEIIPENWDGNLAIAHTRWATHGGVTEANAHPHTDCHGEIFLAHNGIVENYRELKVGLVEKGHIFRSETDTEIISHLIEEVWRENHSYLFEDAVRIALTQLKGAYGVVIVSSRDPEKLIAARNFSPLLLGIGKGEYFVASDPSAVLKHTKQVIYLDDGEMAVLTQDAHHVYDFGMQPRAKKMEEVEWSYEEAQKGGYPHFMLKEIFEQPEAIENSIRGRVLPAEGSVRLGGLCEMVDRLRGAKRILIAACGTAYFAAKVGEYMLEEYAGIPVKVDIASEFRYRKPIFREGDVMLLVSQSGETADTLAALREAKEKGILTLGIVNVVGSTLARETDAGVYQHIGPEIGVASTKVFTSQLAILTLLTVFLGRQREMSRAFGERIGKELMEIPRHMRKLLLSSETIKVMAEKYRTHENFFFLGRKYNTAVAYEGALKLKEIAYVHAEGYGAGEMKHGPIALINERFPSVVAVPQDSVYEKMISNIEQIKARKGPIIAIATEGDMRIRELADDVVYIPKTLEMLTPLLMALPLQLFAYHFGVLGGHDVDKPRNLAKSVTVE